MSVEKSWFSCLLIFQVEGDLPMKNIQMLESIMIFRATDFEDAHMVSIELGKKRAVEESVKNRDGSVAIRLEFKYVKNIDMIGDEINRSEVWSRLSDIELPITVMSEFPSQTI